MTDESRFWDRIADRYAAMPVRDPDAYGEKLAILRNMLTPETDVLEVGCGTGSTAVELATFARSWRGVDFSARMVEIARRRAAGMEGLGFDCLPLAALSGETARYDVLLAMNLVHLLDDRAGALRSIHALLRPDGRFVSSTFCLRDASLKLRLLAPLARLAGFLPRIRPLSGDALVGEIVAAGFAIERRWSPARNKALFVVARRIG